MVFSILYKHPGGVWETRVCGALAAFFLVAWGAKGAPAVSPAGPVLTVAQDGSGDLNGNTDAVLQQAIDTLRQRGGGTLRVRAGVWRLRRGLRLHDVHALRIIGEPGTVLRADPGRIGHVTQPAEKGSTRIVVDHPEYFLGGMRIELHARGRKITSPAGKVFYQDFVMAAIKAVEGARLVVTGPLPFPIPAGTPVLAVFNGISIHAPATDVLITGLTLDMARSRWPVRPRNHTYHCCIYAVGPYSYSKGPTGPPVERLRVVDCELRNAHYRGAAFYSVVHSGVYHCRIENTGAEGIDFDHFCYYCEAVGNSLRDVHNIELNDASWCLAAGNTIERPGVGIVVWQWCRLPELNVGNLLLDNRIIDAREVGIRLAAGADRNVVTANRIERFGTAAIEVLGRENILAGNVLIPRRPDALRLPKTDNGNIVIDTAPPAGGKVLPK